MLRQVCIYTEGPETAQCLGSAQLAYSALLQVKGEEPKKHFLWTVRSKDEATDFWKREFNKQPVDATGKEPKNLKDPRDEKDSVVI